MEMAIQKGCLDICRILRANSSAPDPLPVLGALVALSKQILHRVNRLKL